MSDSNNRKALWPEGRIVSVSDAEILHNVAASLPLAVDTPLTAELIYKAFVEAKKENDSWIKYYMISVALLCMAATSAITEISIFGTKLNGQFIGPTAILYFAICTIVYTNHELKMRMFRAFFKRILDSVDGSERGQILLRYPLAYYGGEFLAWAARPAGFVVGWRFLLMSVPTVLVTSMGWLLAVFGLMALLGFSLDSVYGDPKLSWVIKVAVFAGFFGSMFACGAFLRSAKTKHDYTFDLETQAIIKSRRMQ